MDTVNDRQPIARTSPARSRNPQGEGGRLRDELIAAAGRLIAEGAETESLSLRAVAREAAVAAPSVYLQFESKEALLHAVVAEHFARFRQAIEAAVATGTDPATRLLNGCLAYGRFAAEHPGSYRIIFETQQGGGGEPVPGTQLGMDAFQTLIDAVAACIDAGLARPGDPFQIATDIWVALHGMATLRQRMRAFPWPEGDVQVARVLEALTGIEVISQQPRGEISS